MHHKSSKDKFEPFSIESPKNHRELSQSASLGNGISNMPDLGSLQRFMSEEIRSKIDFKYN